MRRMFDYQVLVIVCTRPCVEGAALVVTLSLFVSRPRGKTTYSKQQKRESSTCDIVLLFNVSCFSSGSPYIKGLVNQALHVASLESERPAGACYGCGGYLTARYW